jgi:hypothetical protein
MEPKTRTYAALLFEAGWLAHAGRQYLGDSVEEILRAPRFSQWKITPEWVDQLRTTLADAIRQKGLAASSLDMSGETKRIFDGLKLSG